MRTVRRTGLCLAISILLLFTGTSYLSSALYSGSIILGNSGRISAKNVIANSGSPEDIQTAVNAVVAAGGGVVFVPEGTFDFVINASKTAFDNRPAGVVIPGGVSVFGAGIGRTVLRQPSSAPRDSAMFTVDGGSGYPVRISGITFKGYVKDERVDVNRALSVYGAKDFRIDHCEFIDFANTGILTSRNYRQAAVHQGVIDHCVFDNPYKDDPSVIGDEPSGRKMWAYGIIVLGTGFNWEANIDSLLGEYRQDTIYIEDCNFSRCRHSVASNAGGWYVIRYCTLQEPRPEQFHMIDVHGSSGSAPAVGGRGFEAYNNTLIGCQYPQTLGGGWHSLGFGVRGGGGVIFNNTITNCEVGVQLQKEGDQTKCWVQSLYIWNNDLVNMGTLISNSASYVEDVDYFLFQKSGYTPYTYPHPLTLAS